MIGNDMLRSGSKVGDGLRQLIRRSHGHRFGHTVASLFEAHLRAYYNEDHYDFDRNGEAFALRVAADVFGDEPIVVWDVGANDGSWSDMAHSVLPHGLFIAFEPVPSVFVELAERADRCCWLRAHDVGLSSEPGEVRFTINPNDSTLSSIDPRIDHWTFDTADLVEVVAEVMRGDDVIASGRAPSPDVLKVDVEGHEVAALNGLAYTLRSADGPRLVQFEYGSTYVRAGATLLQVYELLDDAGYHVGRLHPDHVDFEPYTVDREHFRMGNYIAARGDDLVDALRAGHG